MWEKTLRQGAAKIGCVERSRNYKDTIRSESSKQEEQVEERKGAGRRSGRQVGQAGQEINIVVVVVDVG